MIIKCPTFIFFLVFWKDDEVGKRIFFDGDFEGDNKFIF